MRARPPTILVLWCLAACTPQRPSPAPSGSKEAEKNDAAPFTAIARYYEQRAKAEGWEHYVLEPHETEYLKRLRAQSADSTELRGYYVHAHLRKGEGTGSNDRRFDETILARPFEATPYPEWNVDKMVELARVQRLRLHGLDDVRWFLHSDAPLGGADVVATDSSRRFRFRRRLSGPDEELPWQTLVLDDDGVPQKLE